MGDKKNLCNHKNGYYKCSAGIDELYYHDCIYADIKFVGNDNGSATLWCKDTGLIDKGECKNQRAMDAADGGKRIKDLAKMSEDDLRELVELSTLSAIQLSEKLIAVINGELDKD